MSKTWQSDEAHAVKGLNAVGVIRAILRGVPLALLVFGSLLILLALRVIERPLCGAGRPVTPYITQFVCRNSFRLLGMRYRAIGRPMRRPGAVVANHSSWLDIFALNAVDRLYFVSKAEVARWPGIGWLARATGTVFIERDPRRAKAQTELFEARFRAGHKLLFFPEGTSSDGLQILPFKTTLFAPFLTQDLKPLLWVQPVSVTYHAPAGEDPRFYGWWGDMEFAPHLIQTLGARRNGSVEVVYHEPIQVSEMSDRKHLARLCEDAVRRGHRPVLER